ncbi:hypothetical protein T459_22957 [Capsicum annuum]|uniref:Uncharacterized protein n=1 Tax=Capsicum annuum TaxID=4072 RepID=A0A2G2YQZ6_CAPAN|nr:hypothetical protein T459_22957 [Capsicum annuum]
MFFYFRYLSIIYENFQEQKTFRCLISRASMKHMGESREVSATIIFLYLRASSYITGQIICVDRGMTANGSP